MSTKASKLAEQQREPLIGGRPAGDGAARAAADDDRDGGFSWLTALGFLFLTFNSGMAIYRSDGDVAAVAFVGFSYVDLVLLFVCLRLFERSEPNSPARGNMKAAVWILTTLLTVVFSYKVAAIMPVPVKVLVWAMAGATVLGGFYAFFVHRESKERKSCRKDKWKQNVGVMAIVFGSGVLLDLLAVPPERGNGTSLLLALATFLCGTTVTLLTLPAGHPIFGNRRDAVLNCLAFVCVILYILTSLGLLWPFSREPYPWYEDVAAAVALLVMLVLIVSAVSMCGHLPKVGLGKRASRITAGITVVAAGCLIAAAPELSGDAPATTKTASFFMLCVAILGLLVTVLSKINAESIKPSTVHKAEGY